MGDPGDETTNEALGTQPPESNIPGSNHDSIGVPVEGIKSGEAERVEAPETPVEPGEREVSELEETASPRGVVSWPVDRSSPHPEARPDPALAGPESWRDLALITPAFEAGTAPAIAEDMAVFLRARRLRRLVALLVLTILAGATAYALRLPTGQALLAYAERRLADLLDAEDAGDRDADMPAGAGEVPGTALVSIQTDLEDGTLTTTPHAAERGEPNPLARTGETRDEPDRTAGVPPGSEAEGPRPVVNKAVGYLYLRTVPPADVYIDGVKLPVRTPLRGYPVARGRRKLVVKTADGETRGPFTIIVRPGKKKFIKTIVIRKKTKTTTAR